MLLPPIWQRRGGVVVGYRDFPNHFYRSKCNGLLYLQVAGQKAAGAISTNKTPSSGRYWGFCVAIE